MNNNSPSFLFVLDLINIGFTAITWLLPDLSLIAKVIISLILVGVMAIVRVRPQFFSNISIIIYVAIVNFTYPSGSLEFIVVASLWRIFFEPSSNITSKSC